MKTNKAQAKAVRLNRITGEPKKWTCHDHRPIDQQLDCLQVLYSHWRGRKKLSPEVVRKMLGSVKEMEEFIIRMCEKVKPEIISEEVETSDFWKGFQRN